MRAKQTKVGQKVLHKLNALGQLLPKLDVTIKRGCDDEVRDGGYGSVA
jgi:hypothetical protein